MHVKAQVPSVAWGRMRLAPALACLLLLAGSASAASAPSSHAAPGLPAPALQACVVGPDVLCAAEGGCVLIVLGLRVLCLLSLPG